MHQSITASSFYTAKTAHCLPALFFFPVVLLDTGWILLSLTLNDYTRD